MNPNFAQELEQRFLRYVQIDTESDESTTTIPSTVSQFDLLRLLETELNHMGAADVSLTDNGFVLTTIPATVDNTSKLATVALLAHVDTVPAFSGTGVRPIVHRGYDGWPIVLSDDPTQILTEAEFPYLRRKHGEDIVTASGTTLLGADDKAGVAIIMTMASHLLSNPQLPHGTIRLCFTPDEEIGTGIKHITIEEIAADVAYTLDGMDVGELTYESFSADKATVTIRGVSTHPGTSKGIMVNALHMAAKLLDFLPQHTRTPETTSDKEGFIHVYRMSGTATEVELHFILRDYELDGLEAHGELLRQLCNALQIAEPRAQVTCEISAQYRNMRYWLENDMRPVEIAVAAYEQAGIKAVNTPIRGGTDGSQLTERGLPTPNLFTGMQNVHGPREWISIQDMAARRKSVSISFNYGHRKGAANG